MREILESFCKLLKQLWEQYWLPLVGAGGFTAFLFYLIKLLIDDLILRTMKKADKFMSKLTCFLKYLKAHPALIPIILFCIVLTILSFLTYRDTRTPQQPPVEITQPPTFTPEQHILANIELLEEYLNDGEFETAFDKLFTERYQTSYGYTGFCDYEWCNFTNIEFSVVGTPNVPSSEIIGEVVVAIERERINYLGTPVPTSDRKFCYEIFDDKWLIDEMHTISSDNCVFNRK